MKSIKKMYVHLSMAVLLTVCGLLLLFLGFFVAPTGTIADSVLVAFGEVATFAGALFGIDYNYKVKFKNNFNKKDEDDNENNG